MGVGVTLEDNAGEQPGPNLRLKLEAGQRKGGSNLGILNVG